MNGGRERGLFSRLRKKQPDANGLIELSRPGGPPVPEQPQPLTLAPAEPRLRVATPDEAPPPPPPAATAPAVPAAAAPAAAPPPPPPPAPSPPLAPAPPVAREEPRMPVVPRPMPPRPPAPAPAPDRAPVVWDLTPDDDPERVPGGWGPEDDAAPEAALEPEVVAHDAQVVWDLSPGDDLVDLAELAWAPEAAPEPQPEPEPHADPAPEPARWSPQLERDAHREPAAAWVPEPEPVPIPQAAPDPQPVPSVLPQEQDRLAPQPMEVPVSKQGDLEQVLRSLHTDVVDVTSTVLASRDGLPVASTANGLATDRLAAMAAAVLAIGEQATEATPDAPFGHALIRGSGGCLAVYGAGQFGALAVQTIANPNVGLVQVEAPRAASLLGDLLDGQPLPGAVPA